LEAPDSVALHTITDIVLVERPLSSSYSNGLGPAGMWTAGAQLQKFFLAEVLSEGGPEAALAGSTAHRWFRGKKADCHAAELSLVRPT
jgi:hypothetical protein